MTEHQDKDSCLYRQIHPERIQRVWAVSLPEDTVLELAELFKVLGEPSRVKILHALAQEELCVCDLSEILNISSSAISHQLRLLRANKLVRSRRCGKNVFYKVDDEHVSGLLLQGTEHVREPRE